MKTKVMMSILSIFGLTSYSQTPEDIQTKVEKLFQREMTTKNVFNAQVQIYSESLNIDWYFSKDKKAQTTIDLKKPFYTASIGKMFTATAIAILFEQGKLNFNDPMANYLDQDLISGLHTFNGKDYSFEITIAQLLQHTSGLADYFEDATHDGSPCVFEELFVNPNKTWKAEELIEFSKKHQTALFEPGNGYHYTDTEYILLGLIIEEISGMELHEFFERHIFIPLNMKHTYMNLKSQPILKTKSFGPLYAGQTDVSGFESLSADWAGGSIVSTTEDLITFEKALIEGRILEEATVNQMQNWTKESRGTYYGFGLRQWKLRELFPTLPKLSLIGHSGSTASFLYYCPELDVYFSGSFNQTEHTKNSVVFMVKALTQIQKLKN